MSLLHKTLSFLGFTIQTHGVTCYGVPTTIMYKWLPSTKHCIWGFSIKKLEAKFPKFKIWRVCE